MEDCKHLIMDCHYKEYVRMSMHNGKIYFDLYFDTYGTLYLMLVVANFTIQKVQKS